MLFRNALCFYFVFFSLVLHYTIELNSCDSGRGQVKAEGIIGMARAFLSAGAHSVLVSLWRVPDESANIFMQYFYQFLVNGLLSFQALQRSMQCMRCFHKYSHFVHWSGFHIIGKEIILQKNTTLVMNLKNVLEISSKETTNISLWCILV